MSNLSLKAASTIAFFYLEKVKNYFRFLVFSLGMDEYISFPIISKNICLHWSKFVCYKYIFQSLATSSVKKWQNKKPKVVFLFFERKKASVAGPLSGALADKVLALKINIIHFKYLLKTKTLNIDYSDPKIHFCLTTQKRNSACTWFFDVLFIPLTFFPT